MKPTINIQTATEKEIEELRLTIKELEKEIEELKVKHIKFMMYDYELRKVQDKVMMQLLNEKNITINQLEEKNRRLKNKNKELRALHFGYEEE